jgi:SAM-dependent methyltransferase
LRKAERIADVGCGRGIAVLETGRYVDRAVDGFELNQNALSQCPPVPGSLYVYNFFDFNEMFRESYDLFLLLDVLEHIRDDAGFLRAMAWHLKPGGKILVNVPANQAFFSRYDEAAGHYRRYDAAGLAAVMKRAGLRPLRHVNWGYVYLPLIWMRKRLSRNLPEDQVIEKGFDTNPATNAALAAWSWLDWSTGWRAPGTSLLMLAEKTR